jgi:hypothetical protein
MNTNVKFPCLGRELKVNWEGVPYEHFRVSLENSQFLIEIPYANFGTTVVHEIYEKLKKWYTDHVRLHALGNNFRDNCRLVNCYVYKCTFDEIYKGWWEMPSMGHFVFDWRIGFLKKEYLSILTKYCLVYLKNEGMDKPIWKELREAYWFSEDEEEKFKWLHEKESEIKNMLYTKVQQAFSSLSYERFRIENQYALQRMNGDFLRIGIKEYDYTSIFTEATLFNNINHAKQLADHLKTSEMIDVLELKIVFKTISYRNRDMI